MANVRPILGDSPNPGEGGRVAPPASQTPSNSHQIARSDGARSDQLPPPVDDASARAWLEEFAAEMLASVGDGGVGLQAQHATPLRVPSLEQGTHDGENTPSDPVGYGDSTAADGRRIEVVDPGFNWDSTDPGWKLRKIEFLHGAPEYTVSRISQREIEWRRWASDFAPRPWGDVKREKTLEEAAYDRLRNQDRSGRRAKRNLRFAVKQLGLDRMLTLTARAILSRDQLLAALDRFRRGIVKARGAMFPYRCVLEPNARGGFHAHMAIKGWQDVRLIRSIWRKALGGDLPGKDSPGNVDISRRGALPRPILVGYLCKYLGKDVESGGDSLLYRKRVMGSKFSAVRIVTWYYPAGKFVDCWDVAKAHGVLSVDFESWHPPGDDSFLFIEPKVDG